MFDLRYHVASLAAVFVALIIGILVGVGLASRGEVSNPERTRLNNQIQGLRDDLARSDRLVGALSDQQAVDKAFSDAVGPVVMAERLRSLRIGIVFAGPVDGAIRRDVLEALRTANAAPAVPLRALKVPINVQAVDNVLASRPAFARYVGDERLDELGVALGQQLPVGGDSPLWAALVDELVEERVGLIKRLDGLVVVRSAPPQGGPTGRLLAGFYAGLADAGIPVVGVERKNTLPTTIPVLQRSGLTTVDNVDMAAGRLALVVLLSGGGARGAHYGVKDGAVDVLPPVEAVPAAGG